MFQPNSSAARAGKVASRSRVTVNRPLTMSSGERSAHSINARSGFVGCLARISAARSLERSWRRECPGDGALGRSWSLMFAGSVRLMLVTDDRLLAGRGTGGIGARGGSGWRVGDPTSTEAGAAREAGRAGPGPGGGATGYRCWSTTDPTWPSPPGRQGCTWDQTTLRRPWPGRSRRPGHWRLGRLGSQDVEAADGEGFWGVGPWRVTATKADAGAALGPEGLAAVVALAGGRPLSSPSAPCGPRGRPGGAGGRQVGVAVVSSMSEHSDVRAATERYARAWAAGG